MPLARTTIAIEKSVLDRFFRAYPAGRRSKVIQSMIEKSLADRETELTRIATSVETDPEFGAVRADSELWEAGTAGDGLRD